MEPAIHHNHGLNRYEISIDGADSFVEYLDRGNTVVLTHTFVPDSLRGKGIAARLVKHALEMAREGGKKVDPQCSYAAVYMERHAEYADLRD